MSGESLDEQDICNKTYFMEHYVNKNKTITLHYLRQKCERQYKNKCDGVEPITYYSLGQSKKVFYLLVSMEGLKNDTGCWGYAIHVQSDKSNQTIYFNFNLKMTSQSQRISYIPSTQYSVTATILPTGNEVSFQWESPSSCQEKVFDYIYPELRKHNCSVDNPDHETRMTFSSELCSNYSGDQNFTRVKERLEQFEVTNCGLGFAEKEPRKKEKEQKKNILIIYVVSAVLTAFMLVILALVIFLRRRKIARQESSNIRTNSESDLTTNGSTSVMILHRPGCELLELFLKELADILKSYDIVVKLVFLEQHTLDAEGGIASFMQRNIDSCDYILIMFTENTPEDGQILKHRYYEFALRHIRGLAYHENKCSRYIPMYLPHYKEAVHLLPSFMHASSSSGYRLPKGIYKLICAIKREMVPCTKERQIKNKCFIDRMEEHAKKILEKEHPDCIRENCYKGLPSDNDESLSQVWASTVYSKVISDGNVDKEDERIPVNGITESTDERSSYLLDYLSKNQPKFTKEALNNNS